MQNTQKPLARTENLVVQDMPDEVLIYNLQTNKAFCLNKSAAAVWKKCDGRKTVSEIAQSLKNEFKSPVNEDFVWLAIDQLTKDDLMARELQSPTVGLSRREVMRRVGIASLIALPLVGSLMAPTAAHAVNCPYGPQTNPRASCTLPNGTTGVCCGSPQATCQPTGSC